MLNNMLFLFENPIKLNTFCENQITLFQLRMSFENALWVFWVLVTGFIPNDIFGIID